MTQKECEHDALDKMKYSLKKCLNCLKNEIEISYEEGFNEGSSKEQERISNLFDDDVDYSGQEIRKMIKEMEARKK